MILIIIFIASIKAYFYIYFIIIPLVFLKINFILIILIIRVKIITFLFIASLIHLTPNYLSTGCFIFPIKKHV